MPDADHIKAAYERRAARDALRSKWHHRSRMIAIVAPIVLAIALDWLFFPSGYDAEILIGLLVIVQIALVVCLPDWLAGLIVPYTDIDRLP